MGRMTNLYTDITDQLRHELGRQPTASEVLDRYKMCILPPGPQRPPSESSVETVRLITSPFRHYVLMSLELGIRLQLSIKPFYSHLHHHLCLIHATPEVLDKLDKIATNNRCYLVYKKEYWPHLEEDTWRELNGWVKN